jgi:hypothetical protein
MYSVLHDESERAASDDKEGAIEIKGSPEQPAAASHAIVQKAIEKQGHLQGLRRVIPTIA